MRKPRAVQVDEGDAGGLAAGGSGIFLESLGGLLAEEGGDGFQIRRLEFFLPAEAIRQFGNGPVFLGLADKLVEIGKTRRVEEAKAGEVSLAPELFRRRGEEKKAGGFPGDRLDGVVFGAGRLEAPLEVVGFVDDHEVPRAFRGLDGTLRMGGDPGGCAEDELVVEEGIGRFPGGGIVRGLARIRGSRLDREGAFFVVDGEGE